jgi:DNA-binding NtrC family response regulator
VLYSRAEVRATGFDPPPFAMPLPLRTLEARGVEEALHYTGGSVAAAARMLEVKRERVYQLAKRHGIDIARMRQIHERPGARQKLG